MRNFSDQTEEKEHVMPNQKFKQNFSDREDVWALLVIDVQIGLFKKSSPIFKSDELLTNINLLVDKAREKNVQVIYIQHSHPGYLVYGSEEWQFHPKLQIRDKDRLIHKLQGNAFEGTHLEELLDSNCVNHLIITGLVTHGCVKGTVVGALELGYQVTLVEDGHSNYSKDAFDLIIKWNQKLCDLGAKIKKTEQIGF